MISTGALLSALLAAVFLSGLLAWLVAALYRRRMVALMRAGPAPDAARPAADESFTLLEQRPAVALDLAANRRASRRFLLALGGVSLLVGLTQSWLALLFVYDDPHFSLNRLLVLGLVYAWPMTLAWGLALRWSLARTLGAVLAYMAVMAVLVMLRSNEN